jgi:DNA mismatch repair protein MutS
VKKDREKGRLSQLFIFFHKIHHSYFSHVRTDIFPAAFENKLKNINRMLSDLDVEKYQAIVRNRGFTIAEIIRLLRMIGKKIRNGEMDDFWKDFFLFEAYLSVAKGILKNEFNFPEFSNDGLSITGFYHPLVKAPVKNSLCTQANVTLITGPNMSGKSTLLKAIGLCVYLAHLGLAVPAERCELGFFDVISIAIDLNDDIKSGYSHFMTEIKNLKSIVIEARHSKKCFAIFDELFRGTNAEDALAISQRTIEGLTQFHTSVFFISTHLHRLRDIIAQDNKISTRFIECKLINNIPVFTYKLQDGWSDLKIGQIIFEQEGLNELLA